jgi:hypothetical protein
VSDREAKEEAAARSAVASFKLENEPAAQLELSRIVCRAGVGVKLV